MTSHEEEQRDEIEAIESIYPDSFKVVSSDPHCFCIDIETTESNSYEEEGTTLSASLQFTFTPNYPDEAPLFEVISCEGFPDDDPIERIEEVIAQQIDENLGMVMIFTIVSAVQEFLNEEKDEIFRRVKEEQERKEREIREAEERKCHGTPVTVASFLAWKARFDAEMKELAKKSRLFDDSDKKLSGKEIFLQMKNISDDSELLEGEEAVEVDESLFEDLDDLELEEELDGA